MSETLANGEILEKKPFPELPPEQILFTGYITDWDAKDKVLCYYFEEIK